MDENEHVFHPQSVDDKADEVLSAKISKLSVNDQKKDN